MLLMQKPAAHLLTFQEVVACVLDLGREEGEVFIVDFNVLGMYSNSG